MKRYFFFILSALLLLNLLAIGQGQDPSRQTASLQFDQEQFNGRFCVFTESAGKSNFFVADMTRLTSRFEKVYFMMLTFGDKRIISITSDISKEQMWFKSNNINPVGDILTLFNQLKEKTALASAWMTGTQQAEWLKSNDKYPHK